MALSTGSRFAVGCLFAPGILLIAGWLFGRQDDYHGAAFLLLGGVGALLVAVLILLLVHLYLRATESRDRPPDT